MAVLDEISPHRTRIASRRRIGRDPLPRLPVEGGDHRQMTPGTARRHGDPTGVSCRGSGQPSWLRGVNAREPDFHETVASEASRRTRPADGIWRVRSPELQRPPPHETIPLCRAVHTGVAGEPSFDTQRSRGPPIEPKQDWRCGERRDAPTGLASRQPVPPTLADRDRTRWIDRARRRRNPRAHRLSRPKRWRSPGPSRAAWRTCPSYRHSACVHMQLLYISTLCCGRLARLSFEQSGRVQDGGQIDATPVRSTVHLSNRVSKIAGPGSADSCHNLARTERAGTAQRRLAGHVTSHRRDLGRRRCLVERHFRWGRGRSAGDRAAVKHASESGAQPGQRRHWRMADHVAVDLRICPVGGLPTGMERPHRRNLHRCVCLGEFRQRGR